MMKSGISQYSSLTVLHTRCASMLQLLKFKRVLCYPLNKEYEISCIAVVIVIVTHSPFTDSYRGLSISVTCFDIHFAYLLILLLTGPL